MQVRVPFVRPSGARRGGSHDGGRQFAGSMGQNAEWKETRDHPRRPVRDGNFPRKIELKPYSRIDLLAGKSGRRQTKTHSKLWMQPQILLGH